MRTKSIFLCAAGVLVASIFVSFEDRALAQRYIQSKQPAACTQEYVPVCGVKHGRATTFPNACVARSVDARIVSRGSCQRRPVSVRG
jgi:hypothetical protein